MGTAVPAADRVPGIRGTQWTIGPDVVEDRIRIYLCIYGL